MRRAKREPSQESHTPDRRMSLARDPLLFILRAVKIEIQGDVSSGSIVLIALALGTLTIIGQGLARVATATGDPE